MVTITLPRTYPFPVNSPSRYSIVFPQFCNKLSPSFEAALFGQTCSVTSASGKGSQGLGSRGASEGVVSVDSQQISSGYSNCIGLFNIKCCWSQDYRCSHPFTISCTIPSFHRPIVAGVHPWQSQSLQLRSESCCHLGLSSNMFSHVAQILCSPPFPKVIENMIKCLTRLEAWLVLRVNSLSFR